MPKPTSNSREAARSRGQRQHQRVAELGCEITAARKAHDQARQLLVEVAARNAKIAILIDAHRGAACLRSRLRINYCHEFHILQLRFIRRCTSRFAQIVY